MKIPEKNKDKKGKLKLKHIPKAKKEHVLVVAQEIKFARLLSGNEKKTRDRVLKSLKKWLLNCFEKKYEFKEDDFVRVWKGLFYAVWMSDKPLVQEELCENIAGVLDVFPSEQVEYAVLMTRAGLRVLATEWYGIDHHRMDKFLMLVRRYLRGSLRALLRCQWSLKSCQMYGKMLAGTDGLFALKTPHYARNALSMQLHVVDCYLEEIAKVSQGSVPGTSLVELLRPFCSYMCGGEAPALCAAARRLLTALLRQSSPGLKYQHATRAWKQMGCPEGGPEALELVSDDDDDEQENGDDDEENGDDSGEVVLDPRAGRVDVELACLPVPAEQIAQLLRSLLPKAASKAYKRVKICLERFEQLSRDEYPLRERAPSPSPSPGGEGEGEAGAVSQSPRDAALALRALEKTLVASSDELAIRGLSRKHRKRLLAKSRAGTSIVEDLEQLTHALSTHSANGDWQVEATEPSPKKPKQDTSNKENRSKKKRKHDKTDAHGDKKRKTNGHATHKRLDTDNGPKAAENGQKGAENRQKGAENGPKVAENGQKAAENGPKVAKNGSKILAKSAKLDKKKKKSNKLVENGVKQSSSKDTKVIETVKSDTNVVNKQTNISKKTSKPQVILKESTQKDNKINTKSTVLVNKVKHFQKQSKTFKSLEDTNDTPKKVKFVLKNNSMQGTVDYYKSVRQSPSIPFDSSKQPTKTNLKPSTPSPINPFIKKKLRLK